MSPALALATARRVLSQLRRDPRTIALLLVVPVVLITLLKYVMEDQEESFQRVAAPLLGLFPFIVMFLTTSITMLRERTTGTLERLMTLPIAKLDLLAGYGIAFGLVATAQALVVSAVGFGLLGIESEHSPALVAALAVANGVLGMALGLFLSAFASTEFQAVQFMPAFVLPQLLLCGLFVPRENMAGALEALAAVLPLTYAYDALELTTHSGDIGDDLALDIAVILGCLVLALALGALTLRRRTP